MKPNIIYLVTHDTGRFLGCSGRPIPFTPNLDRFAGHGIQFNHAFCSAPCCGPSRNCAMTGKSSHVTGTIGLGGMGWCLPDEEQTTVDYLNDAGYHTAHIGFSHERHSGRMRYQLDGVPGGDEHLWNCDSRAVVDNAIDYLRTRARARRKNCTISATTCGNNRTLLVARSMPPPLQDPAEWPVKGKPVPVVRV